MAIEREIHRLLYEADCVIVPGFGGFLAHPRGAQLDEARRLIHPPSKEVSFNRRLMRNDGLLADRIAEREGIPHEKAVARIGEEVGQWLDAIKSKGRVELTGIGVVFRGREDDLEFTPDPAGNFLKDAFGLRTIPAIPVTRAIVRQLTATSADAEDRRAPVLWAAAAVAALLFGAGAWFAYDSGVMDGAQLGSFQLFGPDGPVAYHARLDRPAPIEEDSDETWSLPQDAHGVLPLPLAGSDAPPVNVDFGEAPETIEAVEPPVPTTSVTPTGVDKTAVAVPTGATGRYHVVGGCFSIKENADNFILALRGKGFDAGLIDQYHGLYRVAFGSYPERSMALEALAAVRKQEGADAWLLVR